MARPGRAVGPETHGKFRRAGELLEEWAVARHGSLAKLATKVGVAPKTVRLWVNGTSWPRSVSYRTTLRGLGLPVAVENEWWKVLQVGLELDDREVAVIQAWRDGDAILRDTIEDDVKDWKRRTGR